jgi:hypothetical protein
MSKFQNESQNLGSQTAINGFNNEGDVRDKFKNWKNDLDAQKWLEILGYELNLIEDVDSEKITGNHKPDIFVEVKIKLKNIKERINISVKLVSNPNRGFNQIDKRWIDIYQELWDIPLSVVNSLKLFTGEKFHNRNGTRQTRRLFLDELNDIERQELLDFFKQNKKIIISDILKGRNVTADWMLVSVKHGTLTKWVLKDIEYVLSKYNEGEVLVSPKGSLNIGRVSVQRKGGDNGRDTAKMLQFKFNPLDLID